MSRPKHGFNVPIDFWLKGKWNALLRHCFSEASALHRLGLIDARRHAATALRMLDDPQCLHGHTLFCYITLNR